MATEIKSAEEEVTSKIYENFQSNDRDAIIWLDTFNRLVSSKNKWNLSSIISNLYSKKYSNEKPLFVDFEIEVDELEIVNLYPAKIKNPDDYNNPSFLKTLSRSLQKFFAPYIIVELISNRRNFLEIKFKVNTNVKKLATSNKTSVEFKMVTDFSKEVAHITEILCWWSSKTKDEPNLVYRPIEYFQENLLCAVFAFRGRKIIGAAGMVHPRDKNGEVISFRGKQVIELISNYVTPAERQMDIATIMVQKRLVYVEEKNFLPIAVTSNVVMPLVFHKLAKPVEEMPKEFMPIRSLVKDCHCNPLEKPDCKVCPLANKAIWLFPDYV